MFCVKCGAEVAGEDELYEHLCAECFVTEHTFAKVDPYVDVTFCTHCGAYERRGRWFDTPSQEAGIERMVMEHISIYPGASAPEIEFGYYYEDPRNIELQLMIKLWVLGLEVEEALRTKVRLKQGVCKRCSRKMGNYFEVVLQVRAGKRKLSEEEHGRVKKIVHETIGQLAGTNRDLFLTREEEMHGGLDYYLSEQSAGRQVAKLLQAEFGGKLTESASLIGKRDGRDLYRTTVLLRLPRLRRGDFVQFGTTVYRLLTAPMAQVRVRELRSGEEQNWKLDELEKGWYIGGGELVEHAVVVSETGNELQIMDPASYRTVDLVKPGGFERAGDSVAVVRVDDELYLVG